MRCVRCGNENPGTNRFCGMCGATLLPAQEAVTAAPTRSTASPSSPTSASVTSTSAIPTSAIPVPTAPASVPQNTTAARAAAPVSEERPVISGPSFLGLNEPAPRKRGSLSIDPQSAPSSGNLDYLLDDDEEPRRGGAGKFILIVVALALAVGLGYLRWKNQNFGWLNSGKTKPTAAAQNSDADDSNAPAPSTGTTAPSPATPPIQPATGTASQAATDTPSAAGSPAVNPAGGTTPPGTTSAASDAGGSGGATAVAPATQPVAAKDSTPDASDTAPPTPAKPKPVAADVAPKPRAVSKPVKVDPVSEAQRYIYGKGVRQDCDRGLRLLKPAADQANPKAMIEMGALYSAGLCTPHDLPTAYRWFALALRKEPDNQSVQTDLQKLWGEMTQPERQLAIKLSQ